MSCLHMSVSDLAELAQLLNLYRKTYDTKQAEANELLADVRKKISDSPVSGYSEQNPRGAGRHSVITAQQKAQVLTLYSEKKSIRQIVAETGVSIGSVHKLINEQRTQSIKNTGRKMKQLP